MRLAARGRIFLARHRWVYWLGLAASAAAIWVVVDDRLVALDTARSRWDEVHTVYVARGDHQPDDPFSVDKIELPVAAIPPSALTEPPVLLVARRHIGTGEILVDLDVMAVGSLADRAASGTVVVGVSDVAALAATVGARVHVASEGLLLAQNGTVVDVRDDIVYIAVDNQVAAMVAHAAQIGTASLLFVP